MQLPLRARLGFIAGQSKRRGRNDPQNSVLPSHNATSAATVGTQITGTAGTWTPANTVLTYQWQRNTGSWVDISGATALNYTPVDADFGYTLRVLEIPDGDTDAAVASAATAAVDFAWLLKASFEVDAAAPLSSPYTEGIGTLTLVQTDGQLSKSAGKLVFPAQASAAWGDQGFYDATGLSRTAGRVVFGRVNFAASNKNGWLGWSATAAASNSTNANNQGLYFANGVLAALPAFGAIVGAYAAATDYDTAVVLTADGAYFFIKGGAFTDWTLLWVSDQVNTATMYAAFSNFDASGTVGGFAVRDLAPTAFTAANGLAVVNQSAPASVTPFTATADGIAVFSFTLPASPSAGDQVGVDYRVQDANNKWRAFLRRNDGNTAWDFRVRTVSGGVESTPAGWTDVTGVGSPTRVMVVYEGSAHSFYTRAGAATPVKRGATLSVSHLNSETAVQANYVAGTTSAFLKAYARTSAVYDELDRGSF